MDYNNMTCTLDWTKTSVEKEIEKLIVRQMHFDDFISTWLINKAKEEGIEVNG